MNFPDSPSLDDIHTIGTKKWRWNGKAWQIVVDAITPSEIITKLSVVDGPDSGLDADLLDGQHGAYYLDSSNLTGTIPSARSWELTGDVTSPAGSNVTALTNSGVIAGTYTKVTVDAKGRVTTGAALAASDVPTLNQNTTGSAATLTTARTLTIGSTGKTFNGSANVSWTLAEIGAQPAGSYAAASHSHAEYAASGHNHTLDSLSNTTITSNTNGEILRWNGSAWVNNTLAEAGIQPAGSYAASSHNHTLDSLSNVTITSNSNGEILRWNGSAWVNNTLAEAGIQPAGSYAASSHGHAISDVSGLQSALDGKQAAGSYAASSHNHTLDSLSNTTITSNTNGEILRWNGTAWINNTLAEAGIQPAGSYAAASHTHAATDIVSGTLNVARSWALTGDVTSPAGSAATVIAEGAVTLAKMANVATGTIFYRKTAGTGVPELQTLATLKTDLGLTGTNSGDQTITLTGDVTGSGTGSFATTIANDVVTNAKMANMATNTIKGRVTAATGDPEDLSAAQVRTLLSITNVENVALSSWTGSSNLTTIGTLSAGTVPWARLGSVPAIGSSGLTMGTGKLLGRATASSGAVEELTIGSGLSLSAGVLSATASGTSWNIIGAAQTLAEGSNYIVTAAVDVTLPAAMSTGSQIVVHSKVSEVRVLSNSNVITGVGPGNDLIVGQGQTVILVASASGVVEVV